MTGLSKALIFLFAAAALFFSVFPEMDLRFSSFFYHPATRFYMADAPVCRWFYQSVEIITFAWVTLAVLWLGRIWILKKTSRSLSAAQVIYLLMVLAIGPGLIVNVVLKDHWGRARPNDIAAFGGTSTFTPAFMISDECRSNCSFVSGHAAMGFYFIAFGFVFRRHRSLLTILAVIYGSISGLVRIVQGGHFLSDVVFAFFIVYAVSAVLYGIMFERKFPA